MSGAHNRLAFFWRIGGSLGLSQLVPKQAQSALPLTARLAAFAARLSFGDLPTTVVEHAKLSVLDTLGVALAGPLDADLADYLAAGNIGPSRLWWSAMSLPPGLAALGNATRARALDFDDIIPYPQIHVATAVVPAVLAMAEAIGGRDGPTLLTAVVVGSEVQSRLAAAIAPFFGAGLPLMQSSQVFGAFSAAAAGGHLLGLAPEAMQSAFGLALMQAAGTQEMVVHAGDSIGKSLYGGLSNQAGLQAALMARHGVKAHGEALEGRAGLFAALYGNAYQPAALTDGLGTRFVALNRCLKTMPATLVSHAFAEAALDLVRRHKIAPDAIERLVLEVGPWGKTMCEPVELRRAPAGGSAAMNSIPFVVAKAVTGGAVQPADFSAEGLADLATKRLAARIAHWFDPTLERPGGIEPGIVTIHLTDGRVVRAQVDLPLGHPARPLAAKGAAAKFRANAAEGPLPPDRAEALLDVVLSLDETPTLNPLFTLLRP